jgi:hypothetical protein
MNPRSQVVTTRSPGFSNATRPATKSTNRALLAPPQATVRRLQRLAGNRAVNLALQRFPLAQRCGGVIHEGCPCADDEAPAAGAPETAPSTPEVGLEGGPVSAALAQRIDAARGGGTSLDGGTRTQMESAFGRSFGDVRIHADGEAHALNQKVSAVAFTTGRDIFFQQGAYQPGTSDGNQLLAHELTHVVQQQGMSGSGPLMVGPAGDSYEQEADAMSGTIARMIQRCACGQAEADE